MDYYSTHCPGKWYVLEGNPKVRDRSDSWSWARLLFSSGSPHTRLKQNAPTPLPSMDKPSPPENIHVPTECLPRHPQLLCMGVAWSPSLLHKQQLVLMQVAVKILAEIPLRAPLLTLLGLYSKWEKRSCEGAAVCYFSGDLPRFCTGYKATGGQESDL